MSQPNSVHNPIFFSLTINFNHEILRISDTQFLSDPLKLDHSYCISLEHWISVAVDSRLNLGTHRHSGVSALRNNLITIIVFHDLASGGAFIKKNTRSVFVSLRHCFRRCQQFVITQHDCLPLPTGANRCSILWLFRMRMVMRNKITGCADLLFTRWNPI